MVVVALVEIQLERNISSSSLFSYFRRCFVFIRRDLEFSIEPNSYKHYKPTEMLISLTNLRDKNPKPSLDVPFRLSERRSVSVCLSATVCPCVCLCPSKIPLFQEEQKRSHGVIVTQRHTVHLSVEAGRAFAVMMEEGHFRFHFDDRAAADL